MCLLSGFLGAYLQCCLVVHSLPRGHRAGGSGSSRHPGPHLLTRPALGRSCLRPDVCLPVPISPKHMRFGNTDEFIGPELRCRGVFLPLRKTCSVMPPLSSALMFAINPSRKCKHNKPGLGLVHQGATISQRTLEDHSVSFIIWEALGSQCSILKISFLPECFLLSTPHWIN